MPTPKLGKVGDIVVSRPFLFFFTFFFRFHFFFNAITLPNLQQLPTLLAMLIVDVKSGRFMYQSGRVGDEAKKSKSRMKSVRLGISVHALFGST